MFFLNKRTLINKQEKTPLDSMEESAFPVLVLPFNGVLIPVKVRCLNDTQIRSLGEFSLIDISKGGDENAIANISSIIKIKNFQEKLVRETLISPTMAEIEEKIYGKDEGIKSKLKRLESLVEKIKQLSIDEQKEAVEELESLELFTGYLLPTDFMNSVCSWALGTDRSDIKKVSREMLFEAAVLAEKGHDNPSDHIHGEFTTLHKAEIDKASWMVLNDYKADLERDRELQVKYKGYKFIRGGKRE